MYSVKVHKENWNYRFSHLKPTWEMSIIDISTFKEKINEEEKEDDNESVNSKYTLVHRSIGEVVMKEEELS